MSAAAAEGVKQPTVEEIDALRASIAQQGELVKTLKKSGAAKESVMEAVAKLKALREELKAVQPADMVEAWKVDKTAMDMVMIRRMFVVPAFEIYSGVAGLYDFGPPGCALKDNFLNNWKRHFVLQEGMQQLECTTLTPYHVLQASGHVEKFSDLMVKDTKTGECFRADKLLEDTIDNLLTGPGAETMLSAQREALKTTRAQADAFTPEELHAKLTELEVVSPSSGAPLTEPFPFNLMFATSIGPAGNMPGFLRPETAQGMFVNFKRLLASAGGKVPFAATQIGTAYRNEISPKNGLLRVREFTMAEIEHFVHPEEKDHASFATVADLVLTLFPADKQLGDGKTVQMTAGEAVAAGIIANETLGYFVARTALFLTQCGIRPEGLRFRQHLANEMAHYACDCWDAEILMASGWVECVGHADRSAYDLKVHSAASGTDLSASRVLPTPRVEDIVEMKANRGKMGKTFMGDNKAVQAALTAAVEAGQPALDLEAALAADGEVALDIGDGKTATLTRDMVSFAPGQRKVFEETFTPSVIEPSFGVGRILEGIFQHTFYVRPEVGAGGDAPAEAADKPAKKAKKAKKGKKGAASSGGGMEMERTVFAFPPALAPTKVAVFILDGRVPMTVVQPLVAGLTRLGVTSITDNATAAIGRRYARSDELGIPFGVTVDFDTATTGKVTLRERDSTAQVYLTVAEAPAVIRDLAEETLSWADVFASREVKSEGMPLHPFAARPVPVWATPQAAQGSEAAAGAGVAEAATPAPAQASHAGAASDAVVVEGKERTAGRFTRPAVPLI